MLQLLITNKDNSGRLLFFLLWVLAGELLVAADPDPSSFFTSGFLSSLVATDDDTQDEDVSMGSPLHPSPDGFSFFIWEKGLCVS